MEKKTSTKIKERKKKATATTELEESISHPPNHIIYRQNLPISWLPFKNPAILMISRANSQQVCFELKSPALLIKGGTCPADELLLYQIPMDEDDSWRLCGCCFTTHKKNCPNHLRIIAGALAFASNSGCISNQRLLAILHENSADEVLKPL